MDFFNYKLTPNDITPKLIIIRDDKTQNSMKKPDDEAKGFQNGHKEKKVWWPFQFDEAGTIQFFL